MEELPNPSSLLNMENFLRAPGLLGAWLPRVPDGVAEAQGLSSATVTQLGVS